MSSLPTLPQRSWLERLSLAIETALVVVGGLTILGWVLHVDELLKPLGQATFKLNGGVAAAAIGLSLLGVEFGFRRAAWLAVVPTAMGAASLLERLFATDFHINELIARDYFPGNLGRPGQMPAIDALCFAVAGFVLTWQVTKRHSRARLLTLAIVGSLIASVGFSTLVGYGALPAVYNWGSSQATSVVAAFVLVLTGFAFFSLAWRQHVKSEGEQPAWSPVPVVIGCLTLTLSLYTGLRERENAYIGMNTATAMDRLVTGVQAELDRQAAQVERIGNRGTGNRDRWETETLNEWPDAAEKGCRLIEYLDAQGRAIWLLPRENNEGSFNFDHTTLPERRDAIALVRGSKNPAISASTKVSTASTSELGLVIYAPVLREGEITGFVAAEYAYQPLFEFIARRREVARTYIISAAIGETTIYRSRNDANPVNEGLTSTRTYTIADRRVKVSLTPVENAITRDRRYLPELALAAGFGITAFFGLSVHLARRARAGQRAAELSNKRLFAENEERRRVEARLKVSDERLRVALDSTQIGIFEWSVAAGHVYYSPGLWAMLGYDHALMPSTVEAWQALIHPEDLPIYRRRIESQLAGAVAFIEPEYRVRARTGEWRWVYSRSKSVSAASDGRPIRIVGTVQDITARREAELALRESQAEARKLSLVAATTDNPVLITSREGNIEWANEAFCRVMEYSLEEAVGKNPSHFMVGPETNQRTIARIRAAMSQGEGISTDVVNYSKSGRKFHLHVEIQPVRNASGELENFIAVETDITARVETEHQLRRAKAEADDASRAKSEFLASMSHEIRTPMNGVIGMTSLLMETLLTSEQRDYVNTIRTSGEALLTIINDILDFSKIESGKMELERAPFELSVCLEEALDLFALQAAAKKLEIGYVMDADVPNWIIGDVTRLRQVLVNLINNAVKFTPGGSIAVLVRRATVEPSLAGFEKETDADPKRTMLEFTVNDTGIGIPAERVDRLFKAFSQVDSSTTRKYGGTGLGLAICQRLTQLMGGDIRVESRPGQGSAFIFTLHTEAASVGSDSGLPTLPAALRQGPVLCIDDHPVTQARLRMIFDKAGVKTIVVPNISAALAATASSAMPPSLVVADGGDIEGAVPIEALAPYACPRLILFPFGQTAPVAPAGGPPLASVSKPIRTSAFLHAITTLFQAPVAGYLSATKPAERPMGEEIPLEVLLAEDNPVNQKVALRFLERLGYRADAVANGLEAITAIENRRYDLVLMDLQMPEMDGFEATRQIRTRISAERQPKIVALTANAMQGDRDLCVAAGMDDYISKPVKMHEIAAAIRRHFSKSPEYSSPHEFEG